MCPGWPGWPPDLCPVGVHKLLGAGLVKLSDEGDLEVALAQGKS